MKLSHEHWYHLPDERLGNANFNGLPCPTKELVKKIGLEGVNELDYVIKEMLECKKRIYGVDSKLIGFFSTMSFKNINTGIRVVCKEDAFPFLNDPVLAKKYFTFPERAVIGNYWLSSLRSS
jgi:hypothetical protein